eukprot:1144200-Pelagomonas_calceolata.AAC.5
MAGSSSDKRYTKQGGGHPSKWQCPSSKLKYIQQGTAALCRVAQNSEPSHFAAVFGPGSLVIHSGQRPEQGGCLPEGARLYKLKAESAESLHAGAHVFGVSACRVCVRTLCVCARSLPFLLHKYSDDLSKKCCCLYEDTFIALRA